MQFKTIGDVFDIEKGSLQSSKCISGVFDFITAADDYKSHNSYTHDCECLLFVENAEGSLAKVHYYNGKFICSDLLYILTLKKDLLNIVDYKYYYYFLNYNRKNYLDDATITKGSVKNNKYK